MTARAFCFTLNNYRDSDIVRLKEQNYKYLVFGKEVGDSGTPHLQGLVYFENKRSFGALKKIFPTIHLEQKKGTFLQASEYCKKDGDFFEDGELPADPKSKGEAEKEKWEIILQKAREGDEEWLRIQYPAIYFKHLVLFRSHRVFDISIMDYSDNDTPHEWWVGSTGTGKSRMLNENYPDHYPKEVSKWWCGYRGEDVVGIEEWPMNMGDIMASYLKKWVDRYKFQAQVKGGSMIIRPKKVIVLSNYTLEDCFSNIKDLEPFRRRFKVVRFAHL